MNASRIPILSGYILIVILTVAIGYAYYNEENTLALMDEKNRCANGIRREINELNMHLTALSILGETALKWKDEDKEAYRLQRIHIDSTLCALSRIFVSEKSDIDSLRAMLEDKENKLSELADIYTCQKTLGDEMANKLPVIVRQNTREKPQKTKCKGFLGIFGKKEQLSSTTITTTLYSSNQELIAKQRAQDERLKAHTDSLAHQNSLLNQGCRTVNYLDGKAQVFLLSASGRLRCPREIIP